MKEIGNTRSFGKAAASLAVMGIIAKLIGALYRVPLTNIVGAEGMGLYQMVFPLYTVLLAFCGGGITGAVSRVVAKYTALGNDGAAVRAIRVGLVPLLAVSVVCTVAVVFLREFISGIQGNTDASVAYLALCPSLLLAGGINVLRGYFQGRSSMIPSGISQLIEQIIKLTLGLYLGRTLLPYGVKYAVAGALAGVTVSELAALLYLILRYFFSKNRRVRYVRINTPVANAETAAEFAPVAAVTDKALLKELYTFAMSVTLGSLVLPITQMIDSVLVINLLMYGGATRAASTALFGLFVGPVGTLINMPTVVVVSVSIAFLPTITRAVERGTDAAAATRSATKWIMLFVIPITAAFAVFPDRVCSALYSRGLTAEQLATAADILRVQSLSVFYIGILQISTAVLQGHNKAHRPVINLVIGACVKVGFTPLLVRSFGIIGAAGATAACFAVAAVLTARSAYKCCPTSADPLDAFLKPFIGTVLGLLAFWGTAVLLDGTAMPYLWRTVTAAAVFFAVYASVIIVSGALDLRSVFSDALEKFRRKHREKHSDADAQK